MPLLEDTKSWIDLSGKVAHVTGGGHGIGAGIAAALASAGAKVAVSDIDLDRAETVAREIGGWAIRLDVSKSAEVDRAFEATQAHFGGLDIVVNNAGVIEGLGVDAEAFPDALWQRIIGINLDGVFHGCRAAARLMIAAKVPGRIINISSVQAVAPGAGVAYDSAKAGVTQMTRALALEWARYGINVNAIAPGATWNQGGSPPPIDPTPPARTGNVLNDTVANRIARVPAGRWGVPEGVGKAVVFLASPMSDYVTGVYLPVDGGWLLS